MVANGTALQEIMKAIEEEIKISRSLATKAHKLSESVRKDSLSMKTVRLFLLWETQIDNHKIAILTMFFLPGTSFAVNSSL